MTPTRAEACLDSTIFTSGLQYMLELVPSPVEGIGEGHGSPVFRESQPLCHRGFIGMKSSESLSPKPRNPVDPHRLGRP